MKWMVENWDTSNYSNLLLFEKYYNTAMDLWEVPQDCIEDRGQLFRWEFLNDNE
jgi:hypothetical protein